MATVILDAGHGGFDNGAIFQGRREKDDNLNLALAVGNILANNGINVLYTRTDDIYQRPVDKAGIANASGADYFVSFHRNASPEPNMYSGVQTLVYENTGAAAVLAENIDSNLERVGFKNLGTSVRPNLAVLRATDMPAVLIETGFINTEQDNQIFDLKFPEVAQAIADGILQSINSLEQSVSSTEDNDDLFYCIEAGMFGHLENAQNLARHLQKDGFDCRIEEQLPYYHICHGKFSNYEEAKKEEKTIWDMGYETRIVPFSEKKR